MAAPIHIPYLNPIRLVSRNGKKLFSQSIPYFEEQVGYCQKFNRFDTLAFQIAVQKNLGPDFQIALKDLSGIVVPFDLPWQQLPIAGGDLEYFDFRNILASIPEGVYQLHIDVEFGNTNKIINLISEPIMLRNKHDNTVRIDYTHDLNDFGILFIPSSGGGKSFTIRVEGGFASDGFTPAAKDTVYRNQEYDTTLLDSIPFSSSKLIIGDSAGVPNWMADKINRIFSCSSAKIDGTLYSKNEGAKLEPTREKLYPMAGWIIELIKAENSYSDVLGLGDYNNSFNDDYLT